MNILCPDRVTSVVADEENTDYPISNVENDYVEEVWKATTTTAKVTLTVSQGNGCFVYGTNATGITVTVKDGVVPQASTQTFGTSNGKGALWVDYATIDHEHTIELDFVFVPIIVGPSDIVDAAIIRAGDVSSFRDPSQGMAEGLKDYSIIKELNTGALYIKKRAIVRTFNFSVTEDRATDFYKFMLDIMRERGAAPLAWRILSDSSTAWEWIVFVSPEAMPQGDHFSYAHSKLDITLIEAV